MNLRVDDMSHSAAFYEILDPERQYKTHIVQSPLPVVIWSCVLLVIRGDCAVQIENTCSSSRLVVDS